MSVVVGLSEDSLWPALKRRDGEESQHAIQHVVKVEVAVDPLSLIHLLVMKRAVYMLYKRSSENNQEFLISTKKLHKQKMVFIKIWLEILTDTPILSSLRDLNTSITCPEEIK